MKIIYGAPPDNPVLLAKPRPLVDMTADHLGGVGGIAGAVLGMIFVFSFVSMAEFIKIIQSFPVWQLVLGFVCVVLVHEMLHFIGYGGFLPGSKTTFGIIPKMLVVYVFNPIKVSKRRFIFAVAIPTVLLSLVPMVALWSGVSADPRVLLLAVFNAAGAGGDLLLLWFACRTVPSTCEIQSSGMGEFWGEPLV